MGKAEGGSGNAECGKSKGGKRNNEFGIWRIIRINDKR
jgi:hypothetical protein